MVDMKANSSSNHTHSQTRRHTHTTLAKTPERIVLSISRPLIALELPCSRLLSLFLSLPLHLSLFSLFLCAAWDFPGTITWCSAPPLGPPLPLPLSFSVFLLPCLYSSTFLCLCLPPFYFYQLVKPLPPLSTIFPTYVYQVYQPSHPASLEVSLFFVFIFLCHV